MKTRINLVLFIILSLAAIGCDCLVYAENHMPSEFSDRALLSTAKWTDVTFVQTITASWNKYTGTQDFEGEEILNTTKIEICGVTFDVQMRRFISGGTFEFVFVNKDSSFSRDFRHQFLYICQS